MIGSWIRSALWMSEKVIPASHIYPDRWWCDHRNKKSNLHGIDFNSCFASVVFMLSFLKLQPGEKASRFQNALSGFCRFLQTIFKMQTQSRSEPLLGRHLRPAKLQSSMKNTNIVSELDLSPGQMNSNADRKVNRVQTLVGTVAARVESNVKPCMLHQCSAVIRSARPGWDMDMDLCRCVSGRLAPSSCVYAPRNLIIIHRNQRLVLVYR